MAYSTDADAARVAALRELLPATGAGIYLDTATRGPLPAETAAQMRQADDWELAVGRAWPGRDEDIVQRAAEARAVLAALIGGNPDDIVLTHGPGHAVELARRVLGPDAGVASHVDPPTGDLRAVGAPIVDVSLSAGAIPLSVHELSAEAVVLAGDRWLLGPEASGALWLADGAASLDAPALGRTVLLGLARSVGWLEMYVGLEWTYERTARLAAQLHAALAGRDGVELLTSAAGLAAIVSFRLPAWPAADATDELSRRVGAIVRPLPEAGALRASVAWFNTEAELDRFADAVAELGRHTPATLPRRPGIVMLGER